jgi:hypothetical protein
MEPLIESSRCMIEEPYGSEIYQSPAPDPGHDQDIDQYKLLPNLEKKAISLFFEEENLLIFCHLISSFLS